MKTLAPVSEVQKFRTPIILKKELKKNSREVRVYFGSSAKSPDYYFFD